MKQAMEKATDEDREAINEMLEDLNGLLEKHAQAMTQEDTQAVDRAFSAFMDKHGEFFPENPRDIDELLDALAKRSAAAQRLLNSMSPEKREELMKLLAQAFGPSQLVKQLPSPDAHPHATRPR